MGTGLLILVCVACLVHDAETLAIHRGRILMRYFLRSTKENKVGIGVQMQGHFGCRFV